PCSSSSSSTARRIHRCEPPLLARRSPSCAAPACSPRPRRSLSCEATASCAGWRAGSASCAIGPSATCPPAAASCCCSRDGSATPDRAPARSCSRTTSARRHRCGRLSCACWRRLERAATVRRSMTLLAERFAEIRPLLEMEVQLARAALDARGRLYEADESALRYAL